MKKELTIHFGILVIFFLLITILKRWFDISVALFWIGGIVGTLLPDIDHFIYAYYLRPHELTSQRVQYMMQKGDVKRTLSLLATTRGERTNLIFHTAWFQVLFVVLSFWVISSSSSLFGSGLVLGFMLHLVVDQLIDLMKVDTLAHWFRQIPLNWQKEHYTFYALAMFLVVCIFGILL